MLKGEERELGIIGKCFLVNSALEMIVSELQVRHFATQDPLEIPSHTSIVLISFDAIDDLLSDVQLLLSRPEPPRLVLFPRLSNLLHDLPSLPTEVAAIVRPGMGHAEIKAIISLVVEGHRIVPFAPEDNYCSGNTSLGNRGIQGLLTQRQREILREVAKGRTNKAIARSLDISINTVEAHVSCIIRKLNVQNRTQAALMLNDPHLPTSTPLQSAMMTPQQQTQLREKVCYE